MPLLFLMVALPVLCVSAMHLVQAASMIAVPDDLVSTGIAGMLIVIPNRAALSIVLILSALMAVVVVFSRIQSFAVALLLMPQQFLLLVMLVGAVIVFIDGRYFAGVVRTRWFILADQIPRLIIVIMHGASIIALTRLRRE